MLNIIAIIHDIIAGTLILGCTAVLLAVIFVIS
jgi:hypothetical protein